MNDNPMKQPRNLLILLGFVCQGFAWGNFLMPVLFAGVWFLCLKLRRPRQYVPYHVELLIVALLLYLAYHYTGSSEFPKCLAIGNGLLAMQALRLTWPLDHRKKALSIAIALTHIAIGSLVILDYSFLIILAGAMILVPRSLYQLEQERFAQVAPSFRGLFDKRDWAVVAVIMITFFLIFPRRQLVFMGSTGFNLSRRGRLSDQLDTASGGTEGAGNVIFQIEGDEVGYLKSYALDAFDGNRWKTDRFSHALKRRFRSPDPERHRYRKVTVENLKTLGRALPTDGRVVNLRGNFFQDAYVSRQDNVQVSFLWPKPNNFYEYWTSFDVVESLSPKERERYTRLPEIDERLARFVDQVASGETDPFALAKRLENHLRGNFTYKIGVPNLDRSAPVADFIFNAKEGHCERFASAMACLLRIKNIPARVVVGFMPTEKNRIADFYHVRSKDAHAWAEGWFPNRGWEILDATPVQTEVTTATRNFTLSLIDWIEYVWYTKIVNYSFSDQNQLLSFSFKTIKPFLASAQRIVGLFLSAVVAVGAVILASRNRRLATGWRRFFKRSPAPSSKDRREASHFYGRMQKILARRGVERPLGQTPFEFLETLRQRRTASIDAIAFVTERFCDVKYGQRQLTQRDKRDIQELLRRIRRKR